MYLNALRISIGTLASAVVAFCQTNNLPGSPVVVQGRLGVGTATPQAQTEIVGPGGSPLIVRAPIWPGMILMRDSKNVFQVQERSDYTDNSVDLGTPSGSLGWLYLITGGTHKVGISPNGDLQLVRGSLRFPDGSTQTTAMMKGPKGDQGPQGIQGVPGLPGPKGDKGDPGGVTSLNAATGALTLVAGANVTISRSGSLITISVPKQGCKCVWSCCNDASCSTASPVPGGKADNVQQCQATAIAGCTFGYRSSSLRCDPY